MASFLTYLDTKHSSILRAKGITHLEYIEYFSLRPACTTDCFFKCAKSIKTRILYIVNTIKIDLTDSDIIKIICSQDQNFIDSIINDLKTVYQKKYSSFFFYVNEKKFQGLGFDITKYNNITFLLESDVKIDMHSFLFIVNLVIFKDILSKTDEKTLKKYISLILFYGKNDKEAELCLRNIGFPINMPISKLKTSKKFDKLFMHKTFDSLV